MDDGLPQPSHGPASGSPSASPRNSLASGMKFAGFSFAISTALALASTLLTARLFGIDVVGQSAIAMAPLGALAIFSTVGEQAAFVRYVAALPPRTPRVTGIFVAVFGFSMAMTAVMAVIVGAISAVVFHAIGHEDLIPVAGIYMATYFLLIGPGWNFDFVFSAYGDGAALFAVRAHQALVFVIALPIAASVSVSATAVALAGTVSWFTPTLHRLLLTRRWLDFRVTSKDLAEGRRALPEILRFGVRVAPGGIAANAILEAGTWVLASLASVRDVGAYNRAWSLARRNVELTWRISELLMPTLTARRSNGDDVGFERARALAMKWGLWTTLGVAAVGGGTSTSIMWLLGPEFGRASVALAVLLMIPSLDVIASVQNDTLIATGHPAAGSWLSVVGTLSGIAAMIPLTVALGLLGPAFGMIFGAGVRIGFGVIVSRRLRGEDPPSPWPVRQRIGLGTAYVLGLGCAAAPTLVVGPALELPLGAALGGGAFLLTASVFGGTQISELMRFARRRAQEPVNA